MAMDFQPVAYIRMLNGAVGLNATTATPVRVGSSNMEGRKWLYIVNASTVKVFIGSQAHEGTNISVKDLGSVGIKLAAADAIWLPVSDKITVYARSQSNAGVKLRIVELG